jgi:DNA polymerase-3 subunit delta'
MKNSKSPARLESLIALYRRAHLAQALLLSTDPGAFGEVRDPLVRAILCEEEGAPDCACRSCRTPLDSHPDYRAVEPSPKSISRDAVRDAVATLGAGPLWSPAKVIVIDRAELLGREAESYLLKHLEEPPSYVFYLLMTHAPDAIMPTIRSRCQHWRVGFGDSGSSGSDNVLAEIRTEALTPDRVVEASRWSRVQYHTTADPQWLTLWETLQDVHRELEANGNEEIARARVLRAWPARPRV